MIVEDEEAEVPAKSPHQSNNHQQSENTGKKRGLSSSEDGEGLAVKRPAL